MVQSQRRAARFCKNDYRQMSSVTSMLSELKWDALETRRKHSRLDMMYKIQNSMVGVDKDRYTTPAYDTRCRDSTSKKLHLPSVNTNTYKYSYFPRTTHDWNNLSEKTVTATSVEAFQVLSKQKQKSKKESN